MTDSALESGLASVRSELEGMRAVVLHRGTRLLVTKLLVTVTALAQALLAEKRRQRRAIREAARKPPERGAGDSDWLRKVTMRKRLGNYSEVGPGGVAKSYEAT